MNSSRSGRTSTPVTPGYPEPRSISLATAYQAIDPTRAALVVVTFSSPMMISLSAGSTVSGDLRSGPSANVATGGGQLVAPYRKSLTGVLGIGLNLGIDDYETKSFLLPIGGYFAVRQLSGTGMLVISASEQAL